MSRIGKKIIPAAGVTLNVSSANEITVKGPKGELKQVVDRDIKVEMVGEEIHVIRPTDQIRHKALHGLYRTLVNNMIVGVSEQFQKNLTLNGVGYRATVQGKSIVLNLGYSHPVTIEIPEGISIEVTKNTSINIKACDKEQLGLFAAQIRAWRTPEPYKGKGIIYEGEVVRREAGKSGKK